MTTQATDVASHTIIVNGNAITLVSEPYLASIHKDGMLPAVFTKAPYTIIGGIGFYAVPADSDILAYMTGDSDAPEDAILTNEYILEDDTPELGDKELQAIAEMLDELDAKGKALNDEIDLLESDFMTFVKEQIGEERFKLYLKLRQEHEARVMEASTAIATESKLLEDEIKARVVAAGRTVSGTSLQAVFNKGRVSWNTKGLDGYALANPQIKAFRTVGQPYASIRAAAKKK